MTDADATQRPSSSSSYFSFYGSNYQGYSYYGSAYHTRVVPLGVTDDDINGTAAAVLESSPHTGNSVHPLLYFLMGFGGFILLGAIMAMTKHRWATRPRSARRKIAPASSDQQSFGGGGASGGDAGRAGLPPPRARFFGDDAKLRGPQYYESTLHTHKMVKLHVMSSMRKLTDVCAVCLDALDERSSFRCLQRQCGFYLCTRCMEKSVRPASSRGHPAELISPASPV